MKRSLATLLRLPLLCWVAFAAADLQAQEQITAEHLEYFETRIRPVLVEHCYKCHSAQAKKVQGELLLDTREGLRQGGQSGPAVVPGNVADSEIISALRHESVEMPPGTKLPKSVIDDFVRWIELGAPHPRDPKDSTGLTSQRLAKAQQHWAFQPILRPRLPAMTVPRRLQSPIDAFVLARLEEAELEPSGEADRRTLIRRLYFDLLGLPPTPAEVRAFVRDNSPQAYSQLVDRLLASPHYGERWGRHWLDVARYADTKDLVLLYGKDSIRPYAWTYRDYVVRALNQDLPYDQFIHHQLAADRLPARTEPWQLAAMGFLTLGRMFDNNPHDIYDDQIDTVSRGLLGLTVACARCHDHKYDAIPTADYYSWYGIFANSTRTIERPLTEDQLSPAAQEFEQKALANRTELKEFIETQYRQIRETAHQRVDDYLVHVATTEPDPILENSVFFLSLSPDDLKPQFIAAWRLFLTRRATEEDPVFAPWRDLIESPEAASQQITAWLKRPVGLSAGQLNPLVREMLADSAFTSSADVARGYAKLFQTALASAGATPDPATEQLVEIVDSPTGPFFVPRSHTYLYMSRVPRGEYHKQLLELDKLAVYSDSAPARAMVLVDSEVINEPRIFVRGNPTQPGRVVPRRFLALLTNSSANPKRTDSEDRGRQPYTDGSGRLELARSITDPENPLTARVMANRIWAHHFGQPLVATPSDFGTRSEAPTNPKLLDWLAREFQDGGWSIKQLHRLIVTSNVYRQNSFDRSECQSVDPENRLLWRFPRRRLDLESMRDSLLAVSGRLERQLGGRPVDVAGDPDNRRRTIYGLVDRQSLPSLFRVFDFASPDQSAAGRAQTTTPQQALFGMNSPFMLKLSQSLAERLATADNNQQRVSLLYEFVLQRAPDPQEQAAALDFVGNAAGETKDSWVLLAQVLLLTNEFLFVD